MMVLSYQKFKAAGDAVTGVWGRPKTLSDVRLENSHEDIMSIGGKWIDQLVYS